MTPAEFYLIYETRNPSNKNPNRTLSDEDYDRLDAMLTKARKKEGIEE